VLFRSSILDTNRPIRAALLSAARKLLGQCECGDVAFTGDLVVRVIAPSIGLEMKVTPIAGTDGMEPDAAVLAAERVVAARLERILTAFLSPNENTVLRVLAELEPTTAGQVFDKIKGRVGKSAFWELWGNLQQRGLVVQREDDKYRIGLDLVRDLISEG